MDLKSILETPECKDFLQECEIRGLFLFHLAIIKKDPVRIK